VLELFRAGRPGGGGELAAGGDLAQEIMGRSWPKGSVFSIGTVGSRSEVGVRVVKVNTIEQLAGSGR